jgi:hypothetical protein
MDGTLKKAESAKYWLIAPYPGMSLSNQRVNVAKAHELRTHVDGASTPQLLVPAIISARRR